MSQPDRNKVPIRKQPFGGVANRTLRGSKPDWEELGHVEPPDGAPTVLLALIDDAGFGNAGTFGGPFDTPNYTRIARQGVRYNRLHVAALCSPTQAALLTEGPSGPFDPWPVSWGFNYSYGFLGGGASHWDPCLAENQNTIPTPGGEENQLP